MRIHKYTKRSKQFQKGYVAAFIFGEEDSVSRYNNAITWFSKKYGLSNTWAAKLNYDGTHNIYVKNKEDIILLPLSI